MRPSTIQLRGEVGFSMRVEKSARRGYCVIVHRDDAGREQRSVVKYGDDIQVSVPVAVKP